MKGKRSWFLNEEGQLSIDFIIGFTIFMVAFIIVATMMSGILISLQSRTIDYDAVAYRTSVMLIEDPGEPWNWHLLNRPYQEDRDFLKRLGLSISRLSPGLLQQQKVDAFFDNSSAPGFSGGWSLRYPEDYKYRLLYTDYPYSLNITLRKIDKSTQLNLGPELPLNQKFGYVRRVVKIKQTPNMTVNLLDPSVASDPSLMILMNFTKLYSRTSPLYRIEPMNEPILIKVQNVPAPITIEELLYDRIVFEGSAYNNTPPVSYPTIWVSKDGGDICTSFPCDITSDFFYIHIDEGMFRPASIPFEGRYNEDSQVIIKLYFNKIVTDGSFTDFGYTAAAITAPEPAILEVRVW